MIDKNRKMLGHGMGMVANGVNQGIGFISHPVEEFHHGMPPASNGFFGIVRQKSGNWIGLVFGGGIRLGGP